MSLRTPRVRNILQFCKSKSNSLLFAFFSIIGFGEAGMRVGAVAVAGKILPQVS